MTMRDFLALLDWMQANSHFSFGAFLCFAFFVWMVLDTICDCINAWRNPDNPD